MKGTGLDQFNEENSALPDPIPPVNTLPNISVAVMNGDLWIGKKLSEEHISKMVRHLFCNKILNQKCMERNIVSMLKRYCTAEPDIADMLRQLIRASLAGIYPHCGFRPPLETRRIISEACRKGCEEQMLRWITEPYVEIPKPGGGCKRIYWNERALVFMLREFHIHVLSMHPIHRSMLRIVVPQWEDYEDMVIRAMDRMRKRFVKCEYAGGPWVHNMLETYHNHNQELAMQWKCRKKNLHEILLKKQRVPDLIEPKYSITASLGCMDPSMLEAVGMSRAGINLVMHVEHTFWNVDMPDEDYGKPLQALSERDFEIYRTMMFAIRKRNGLATFPLSADYAEDQLRALRRKRRISPWEDDPEDLGVCWYCPSCETWISRSVLHNKWTKVHHSAVGLWMVFWSEMDREVLCAKKHGRKTHCLTPLAGVRMVGTVMRLKRTLWALCRVCGILCPFDSGHFSIGGKFTCLMHPQENSQTIQKCQYCRKKRRAEELMNVPVGNPKTLEVERVVLCRDDYQHAKTLFVDGAIPLRSELETCIKQKRFDRI